MVISPNDLVSQEQRQIDAIEKVIDDTILTTNLDHNGMVSAFISKGYTPNDQQIPILEEMYKKAGWDEVSIFTYQTYDGFLITLRVYT